MSTKVPDVIKGSMYVVGDQIDIEQVLPSQHRGVDLSHAQMRRQLGWYALSGLSEQARGLPKGCVEFSSATRTPGQFPLVVAGKNFGCGTFREEACIALREAGVRAVIAESFDPVFYRNSFNNGHFIPCDTQRERLCTVVETGMEGELILTNTEKPTLYVSALKTSWALGSLGDIAPVLQGLYCSLIPPYKDT